MLLLPFVAAFAGAQIPNAALQSVIAELPPEAASSGAGVELVVTPEGRVHSCVPVAGVGGSELAERMCARLDGSRIRPASSPDGRKAYGLVRFFAQRSVSAGGHESWRMGLRPELEISLNELPDGLGPTYDVTARALIDQDGAVAACEANDRGQPALGALACDNLQALQLGPVSGADGAPVAFVTSVAVRFVVRD